MEKLNIAYSFLNHAASEQTIAGKAAGSIDIRLRIVHAHAWGSFSYIHQARALPLCILKRHFVLRDPGLRFRDLQNDRNVSAVELIETVRTYSRRSNRDRYREGCLRYRTGSPLLRSFTPWCFGPVKNLRTPETIVQGLAGSPYPARSSRYRQAYCRSSLPRP